MKELNFYDLKAKKSFKSSKYKLIQKGKTKFAVTTAPSGVKSMRIVAKDFNGR